jgi:RES domain-containing protein
MKLTAYRIINEINPGNAFSGEGARLYPGRWNHRGVPMVYCAESIALAALEMLVHTDSFKQLERCQIIPVTFDEALCSKFKRSDLPRDWNTCPSPVSTRDLGTAWAAGKKTVVIAVPSAVIPDSNNYLINPLHTDIKKLVIGKPAHFLFDPRMAVKKSDVSR